MRRASETTPLVVGSSTSSRLTWPLAALCIIDLFGVFPVLVLPRPIIDCGWVGLPIAIVVAFIQIYTARLLGQCWIIAEAVDPTIVNKSRYPYSAIAELCFGTKIRMLVSFLLDVTLFGGGIPNLLVASQTLQLVGLKETNYGVNISFCYWLLILGLFLCPLMWLGSPKDMKWIAVTSCCTVLSVAALTWACIALDDTVFVYPEQPSINWEAIPIAYGILAFQFDIHPMILTVQVDMVDKRKLTSAIMSAFTVSFGLFFVTTILAMYKYSSLVRYNLLQGLPGSGLLYANLVLATLQICLSLVVGGSALFNDIEDKLNIPREFNWKRCVVRSCVVLTSVLIAEMVPRFDLVMGLIGGALTGPLMFIFPPLFYLKLKAKQHAMQRERQQRIMLYEKPESELCFDAVLPSAPSAYSFLRPRGFKQEQVYEELATPQQAVTAGLGWCEKLTSVVIIVMGVLATVAATYYSVRDTLKYAKLTPPCFP